MKTPDEESAPEPQPANGPVNILLVDDENRNLDVLESILKSPELQLVRVTTPEDALLALVRDEFACIVLDVNLPSMNGFELARLIKTRKRNLNVPIIFLTAYFMEEKDILLGYGAGAVEYLTKPVNSQILRSKVGVFVDLFRTTRALAAANSGLEMEIAQRKKAEKALRRINTELEATGQKVKWQMAAIVESSDDAIISKDLNGIIQSWNRGAEHLFGYRADEIVGRSIAILIPPERLDEEPGILQRIRNGESVDHYETIRRRKDGTLIDISLTVSPMRDAEGKIIGASKIARDITEQKRAEIELKRAHDELVAAARAKDDFLAMLSHELRTPLNPVLLIASDAVNNRDLPPQTRMDFATIQKNVELEARLIDDLLDLTRIARGKIILEKCFLDVHRVLGDAVATVQEEMSRKKIALDLKLNAVRHTAYADAARLQQIFTNLLRNAVKFTPDGGQIAVASDVKDDRIIVEIADTGIGMQPDAIAHIFTAFSQGNQLENHSARQFGGLGLGLAISQKLAEFHSGKIRATSPGPGQGSTFAVEFPLAQGEPESGKIPVRRPPNPAPNAPVRKNGLRILLVEDHGPTRSALTQLLMRRHYQVVTAESVAEARVAADAHNFNLLISDIGLPDGNGYELMAEFREKFDLPGIALTGYGMEQDIARSRNAGFAAHLTKPVRIELLDNALAAILNQKA